MDTKKITTNESGNDAKREKVRVIPIEFFDDFPKHPFNVKMDAEMEALIESIKAGNISSTSSVYYDATAPSGTLYGGTTSKSSGSYRKRHL